MHLGQESCRSDAEFFSGHPTKRHFLSIRPVTENVNFDCWVKLASASNYKVTAFLFVVNKFLLERCFETVTILLLLQSSPTGFSTHWWFLSEATIITIVAKWWFLYWYFHHSFYIYYLTFYCKKNLSLLIYLLVCLFIQLSVDSWILTLFNKL